MAGSRPKSEPTDLQIVSAMTTEQRFSALEQRLIDQNAKLKSAMKMLHKRHLEQMEREERRDKKIDHLNKWLNMGMGAIGALMALLSILVGIKTLAGK